MWSTNDPYDRLSTPFSGFVGDQNTTVLLKELSTPFSGFRQKADLIAHYIKQPFNSLFGIPDPISFVDGHSLGDFQLPFRDSSGKISAMAEMTAAFNSLFGIPGMQVRALDSSGTFNSLFGIRSCGVRARSQHSTCLSTPFSGFLYFHSAGEYREGFQLPFRDSSSSSATATARHWLSTPFSGFYTFNSSVGPCEHVFQLPFRDSRGSGCSRWKRALKLSTPFSGFSIYIP